MQTNSLKRTSRLITCILPKGVGMTVLKQLKEKRGIITANINHARGSGRLTPLIHRGLGEQTEKEILNLIVEDDQSDNVFTFVYHAAKIDRPHGGLMFQSALTLATDYRLPDDLPEES